MEDVLDLHARAPDDDRPLVVLDEFSKPLLSEVAEPLRAGPAAEGKPGARARHNSEYVREGMASAFMIAVPHPGKREVFVSENGSGTACDYAEAIAFLGDEMFPDAEKIVLVQYNLNTHTPASLYKRFPPRKVPELASRIEWPYTPKHGSWLNIAEIESSVLSDRRINRNLAQSGVSSVPLRP